jgi:hypothetical protein
MLVLPFGRPGNSTEAWSRSHVEWTAATTNMLTQQTNNIANNKKQQKNTQIAARLARQRTHKSFLADHGLSKPKTKKMHVPAYSTPPLKRHITARMHADVANAVGLGQRGSRSLS